MNKCFFDNRKKLVIKNLKSIEKLDREVYGTKTFSKYVNVPNIEKLDQKTILLTFKDGIKGDQIDNGTLNSNVIYLLESIRKNKKGKSVQEEFTIQRQIAKLFNLFAIYPEITKSLKIISSELKDKSLFPVHGDLQKQNIIFTKKGMVLIDFEHFTFAPQELEIVNSLFFNDNNCLDIDVLIPKLIKKLKFSSEMIGNMLVFFAIKELFQGRRSGDVNKRLLAGVKQLNNITTTKTNIFIPDIMKKENFVWTKSSCFA